MKSANRRGSLYVLVVDQVAHPHVAPQMGGGQRAPNLANPRGLVAVINTGTPEVGIMNKFGRCRACMRATALLVIVTWTVWTGLDELTKAPTWVINGSLAVALVATLFGTAHAIGYVLRSVEWGLHMNGNPATSVPSRGPCSPCSKPRGRAGLKTPRA